MNSIPRPSYLRLVGASEREPVSIAAPLPQPPSRAVAEENLAAVDNQRLNPGDPRWVLAARAYAQLDGATLSPERRERLVNAARRLGLRPFDANLIIAIVQDKARQRRSLSDAEPSIQLIHSPTLPERSAWTRWIGATLLAVMGAMILIWWVLSAA